MLKNVENRKKRATINEVRGGEKSVFSFQFSVFSFQSLEISSLPIRAIRVILGSQSSHFLNRV